MIEDCQFINGNSGYSGSAISIYGESNITILRSSFTGC